MRALLSTFVETLYPPRCMACPEETTSANGLCPSCWADAHFISGHVCDRCGTPVHEEGLLCEGCSASPPQWGRGRAAVLYDGTGRRVVLALKHSDRLDAAPTLARWMALVGADLLRDADVIVPVPLHWRRLTQRRYNQAAELARPLAKEQNTPFAPRALHRPTATPALKGMTREQRQQTLSGSIKVHDPTAIAGKNVLLIDDVLTTGATLDAATQALLSEGAKRVDVLILARVARAWTHTL